MRKYVKPVIEIIELQIKENIATDPVGYLNNADNTYYTDYTLGNYGPGSN